MRMQQTTAAVLLEEAKRQGFSLVLLFMAVWYFYQENSRMQTKIDQCTTDQISLLKDVIINNTNATIEMTRIVGEMAKDQKKFHGDGDKVRQ
jgi:hypothetical protein